MYDIKRCQVFIVATTIAYYNYTSIVAKISCVLSTNHVAESLSVMYLAYRYITYCIREAHKMCFFHGLLMGQSPNLFRDE